MSLKRTPRARNVRPSIRGFKGWTVTLSVGMILPVLLVLFLLFGKMPTLPGSDAPKRVLYEVPENTTASELINNLYERRLIAFPEVLNLVFRVTGWEKRIRAGFYYLPARNSVMGIAKTLTSGEMATRTLTIPEGKTSWEIFAILRRSFPADSLDLATFEELAHSAEFARALGVPADNLEGYLYPDTYVVPFSMKERDLLRLMVLRFHEVIADMPRDRYIVERYGVHGWVTLASIVEKEAAVNREQRRIAGVFTNRLRQGWSLGADPTVRYALRKLTGPLRSEDLRSASPYNTRRFRGLPPGPVCNPGESALLATLNPEKTRMMFFVAKDDGSREHYFSVTYAEHNVLKEQAAANREKMRELLARQADSLLAAAEAEIEAPADKTDPESPAAPAVREAKISEADARPDTARKPRPAHPLDTLARREAKKTPR
ncbi:MAG: aminodeoxychorismate lyase [Fibrobacteria bacterium]|jgi:UPF0755 protein|nr:aminodeoxychorismate lyase [Fibrobacteria bacterium]